MVFGLRFDLILQILSNLNDYVILCNTELQDYLIIVVFICSKKVQISIDAVNKEKHKRPKYFLSTLDETTNYSSTVLST